ncbi:GerAB/ArcD/ProY family transporter, partial [Bacillus thuringiensis]
CTTCFYTFLTLACTLFFSPKEILLIPQPVLYLIKSFELSIIERPDIVFTSSWIIIVSSTIMAFLYAASKGGAHILHSYHRKTCTYFGACIVFFITSVCNKSPLLPFLSKIVSTSGLLCAGVLPTLLLLLSFLLKKDEKQGDGI